jgi:hypothetical protein
MKIERIEAVVELLTLGAPGEAPQGITGTGNSLFNRMWTLLGMQIVGAYDDDERVLRLAEWIRQALT